MLDRRKRHVTAAVPCKLPGRVSRERLQPLEFEVLKTLRKHRSWAGTKRLEVGKPKNTDVKSVERGPNIKCRLHPNFQQRAIHTNTTLIFKIQGNLPM